MNPVVWNIGLNHLHGADFFNGFFAQYRDIDFVSFTYVEMDGAGVGK